MTLRRFWCRYFLLSIICFSVPVWVAAQELKVAANQWPPYVDEKLLEHGLSANIVKEALIKAGYSVNFEINEWSTVLEKTISGDYDVIAGAWYTDERAERLAFSEPFITNDVKFIKRRGSGERFVELSDLNGLTIGIVKDYAYGPKFSELKNIKKHVKDSVYGSIRDLIAGDVDLVLADERVAIYEINQNIFGSFKKIEFLEKSFATRELRIAVSKKHPEHEAVTKAFNKAISEMKKDGTYDDIIVAHRINLN